MAVVIPESDMQFGAYEPEQVFQLEKSSQYTKNLRPNGIKSCEFILRRGKKLYFVEAKKSCPKQIKAETPKEKREKYKKYIEDIVLKMRHSLTLYSNILLERYDAEGVPDLLREKNLSEVEIQLVLVVKNGEKEWLVPFQDAFRRALRDELRIWNGAGFYVINEEMARRKRLVV